VTTLSESDIRKPDVHPTSWNAAPSKSPATAGIPPVTKSLKEIQAEEALKAKYEKQSQLVAQAHEVEVNKVTVINGI